MTCFIFRHEGRAAENGGGGGHSKEQALANVKDGMPIMDDSVDSAGADMHGDGRLVGADRSGNRTTYIFRPGKQSTVSGGATRHDRWYP